MKFFPLKKRVKLSPDNIFSEIETFNEEYKELSVEIKNAQKYLTLYYQGALDSWLASQAAKIWLHYQRR